jgi:hypothetical protein
MLVIVYIILNIPLTFPCTPDIISLRYVDSWGAMIWGDG